MIGQSGSPPMKSTITSCPIRGMNMPPQLLPAHGCETRIQHELFSSYLPYRSQWNCTFTRPYLSHQISSVEGPVMMAVCGPLLSGFGVTRRGRYWTLDGCAVSPS